MYFCIGFFTFQLLSLFGVLYVYLELFSTRLSQLKLWVILVNKKARLSLNESFTLLTFPCQCSIKMYEKTSKAACFLPSCRCLWAGTGSGRINTCWQPQCWTIMTHDCWTWWQEMWVITCRMRGLCILSCEKPAASASAFSTAKNVELRGFLLT